MLKQVTTRGAALGLLVVFALACSFIAFGLRPDGIADHYRDTLSPAGFAVCLSSLIVAMLSPPLIAMAFWFAAKKMRHGWVLHLLLVPMIYLVVRGIVAIMLTIAGEPDSDGLTGWATDPAAMLMLLCPLVYFAALGWARLRRRSTQATVR